jgi:hypothetical protein
MPERRTFAPLHPTTRKYGYGEVDRGPLPKQLRELIERLRDAEPIKDPRGREGKESRAKQS